MTDGSDRLSNELHKSPSSRLEDLDSSLVDDEILDDLQKRQSGLVDDALDAWEENLKEVQESRRVIMNYKDTSAKPQDRTTRIDSLASYHNNRITDNMRITMDEHDMARVTTDAGINTFGCIFLEVWVLNQNRTRLMRPAGGAWMDPAFRSSLPDEQLQMDAEYLLREAPETALRVGLAGTIFGERKSHRIVQWRQIESIMTDPFLQSDPTERIAKIFSLGISLVASTTFSFGVDSGMVLFFTRSSRGFDRRSSENERVMLEYTDYIGANFGIIKTREKSTQMRRELLKDAIRKVRNGLVKKHSGVGMSLNLLGAAVLNKEEMEKLRVSLASTPEAEDSIKGSLDQWIAKSRRRIHNLYKIAVRRIKSSPKKWVGAHLVRFVSNNFI